MGVQLPRPINELPPELLNRHTSVSTADGQGLSALFEHGHTVRNCIRSTIGDDYTIDRSSHLLSLFDELGKHKVVIVSGTAGSGKSALAKNLLSHLEPDHFVLAFQAVEFATAHIDETLGNAQTRLNEKRLFALLAGHDKTLILIESVERLLEHSIRDAFTHLLRIVLQDRSIQLVLTVRDYALETVRDALLAPVSLNHVVFEVPALTDDELDNIQAAVPRLAPPLRDNQLRSFLRSPYLLDMASRLDWTEHTIPANAREFREKCWRELIRADHFAASDMPQRREAAFLDIAHRRATELRPFVQPGVSDGEALSALHRDSLIERSSKSLALFAAAHDVLEDWGILRWLDERFAITDESMSALVEAIGGYPAIRRGFRRWLGERFELNPDDTRAFVLRAIGEEGYPAYFRDDCLVSALLSETAGEFLEGCQPILAEGNLNLLDQIIHMLRVACKESPRWLNVPGLPSQMLVPTGSGWASTMQLVSSLIDSLLPDRAPLVLGFVEDWAKQLDRTNPEPDGFKEAGIIVDALLPVFDGYGFTKERNRLLEVLAKIPRAVPQFGVIIERARTCNHDDYMANDLANLVFGSLSGGQICRDFPVEVMSLFNSRFKLSEADIKRELNTSSSDFDVDCYFGIRQDWKYNFFPASALQGPFHVLLQSHPRKAMPFIIELINHAGNWYGNRLWPRSSLEPASKIMLEIPGLGEVEQWMNGRLYGLFRGMTVGPDAIQSALMALESWLLSIGKMDNVDLEAWLLYILRISNNVMVTSVVASVCIAYPKKAGRAGLALLSNRQIIQCDRSRLAAETGQSPNIFGGLDQSNFIYEQERAEANKLEHRQKDLESLAIEMQLTNLREEVWNILDRHRSELSDEQDEDTRIWRLALHRMDVRDYKPTDPPEEVIEDTSEDTGKRIYFGPGAIEPDVQDMVDKNMKSLATTNRHLRLLNQARNAWLNQNSNDSGDWRTTLLSEARAVVQELDEPKSFYRDGPGLVAAFCIRDHLDELDENDFRWCAERIELEVRRNSDCDDEIDRCALGINEASRACASVVSLLAVCDRSEKFLDAMSLLSLALTHPVDEVADYAHAGVSAFLGDEHKELILQCAAAAAYRTKLIEGIRNEEAALPYFDRSHDRELIDRVTPEIRRAIENGCLDASAELMAHDLDSRSSGTATLAILKIFADHPQFDESREFYSRNVRWLAEIWTRADSERRNHQFERDVLHFIARFVLNLSAEEARRISAPLVDTVVSKPQDAESFLHELILAADGKTGDCFWDLWQDIANNVVGSQWVKLLDRGRSFEEPIIGRIFLGIQWKDDAKHWHRLDGQAYRLDDIAQRLPATTSCILAYSNFLYTIGQRSLPESFKVLATLFEKGDAVRMASNSNVAFNLETLLRRFVYSEPRRLKSDSALRNAIMSLLDALVAGGSSSAYRMRDDFVTPSA